MINWMTLRASDLAEVLWVEISLDIMFDLYLHIYIYMCLMHATIYLYIYIHMCLMPAFLVYA